MQATKKIHLNPNGNVIKINGNIYRHYTRNLIVSLPSIFYAISHGATVHEVLNNGETVKLTAQNYALDNEKAYLEKREQEENYKNMFQNSIMIENNILNNENNLDDLNNNNDEENSNQKKSNKKNNSKKVVE